MKFPIITILILVFVAAAFAQEADKPKGDTKPKVLIFPPGSKTLESTPAPATPAPGATPAFQKSPAAATPAPGITPQDLTLPAFMVEQFFGAIREGEIELAYSVLTKGSKIAERPEELRQLKQKTKEAIDVFGVISGYESVENKQVGTRLLRSTYISLGKEFPLRWRFYFYKADKVWRLIDLRVDDKLTGVFEEKDEPKPADVK